MLSVAAVLWRTVFVVSSARAVTQHPLLLILSFDGFHPDFVRPDSTPNLAQLQDASASPPYMRPAFPTKTFVNHFTIATGLYPETHGVLDNSMFDRNNETMSFSYELCHYNDSVVPIWIQNEKTGVGRYSGVMMWPGSQFPYQSITPTHIQNFNESMQWTSRVDKIMSWIKDKYRPANLVLAYFDEPDKTGHFKGIESQEFKQKIVIVDATVKYLLDQIKNDKLENKINIMILSDHGMDTVTFDRMIFLDKYVSNTTYKIIALGPNAFVHPNPGKFDIIFKNLTKGAKVSGRFNVYKKEELPERWHMKNNTRLTGLLYLLANPGYGFWDDYFQNILNQTTEAKFNVGVHGYDNEEPSMRALFMASGPLFKKNFTARPFDNIDLYPLICHVLGLERPTNGFRSNSTMAVMQQLLSPEALKSDCQKSTVIT